MYKYGKRFFDIVFSVGGLVLLAPFSLIVMILIKLDSPGPIFFRARRIGKDEKDFTIYKFRTMKANAPVLPPNKLGDASKYTTMIGRILRKTSLDELPQMWNVLKGDMSFVGPRPGASVNEEDLRLERRQHGVFSVRPGITGWAQVNGRDILARDIVAKTKADQYYVKNLSFRLDLLCVLKTLHVVSSGEGYQEAEQCEKVERTA